MSSSLKDYRETLANDSHVLYLGKPNLNLGDLVEWTEDDNVWTVTHKNSDTAVIFSAIVKLAKPFFFMTPDTSWKGESNMKFERVKQTAVGTKPDQDKMLESDFENVLGYLKKLESLAETKNRDFRSLIENGENAPHGVRLRHSLFAVRLNRITLRYVG